jgi:hypothetical protein
MYYFVGVIQETGCLCVTVEIHNHYFILFVSFDFFLGIIKDIWTEHNTSKPHHLFIGVLHPEYQYRLVQEEPTNS